MPQPRLAPGIQASTVRFGNGVIGFRAVPRGKKKRPAVIILHERYGVVQHTKDLVVKLAQAGFVGLAPDLFSRFSGDRKALTRGDARMDIHDPEALEDLGAAVDHLKRLGAVDGNRIAIMGVCQTGRHALLLAAHRNDLAACVVFYGAIGGKEWSTDSHRPESIETLVENLSCPLLGVFGEADHIISIDDVTRFRGILEQKKKSYQLRVYPGAPHGWLNDTMPGRYRKQAANDGWRLLLSFLKKSFSGAWKPDRVVWHFESDISPDYDFKKNVRLE
jgi:carboxymethylenebutenolidase